MHFETLENSCNSTASSAAHCYSWTQKSNFSDCSCSRKRGGSPLSISGVFFGSAREFFSLVPQFENFNLSLNCFNEYFRVKPINVENICLIFVCSTVRHIAKLRVFELLSDKDLSFLVKDYSLGQRFFCVNRCLKSGVEKIRDLSQL